MTSQRHFTASELTKFALRELSLLGYSVWRANNIAVPGRKFIGRKGMSDIIGYDGGGYSVFCEVKTINDKLSQFQIDFMNHAMTAGCRVFICLQRKDGNIEIKNWD